MSEYMSITDYFRKEDNEIIHDGKILAFHMLILDILNTVILCYLAITDTNSLFNPVFWLTVYNSCMLSFVIIHKYIKIFDKNDKLHAVLMHEFYRNKEND